MTVAPRLAFAAFSFGLLVASAASLPGCDSSENGTTTKPIESNILKKLGQASQEQSEVGLAKRPGKAKDAKYPGKANGK
jgi:hypothetical protein